MNKKNKFLILFICSLLSSFFLLEFLGEKLTISLYNYVNIESKRLVSNIVNSSVNDIISENLTEELFVISKNKQNEIEVLDYNTKQVNIILKKITENIQTKLLLLEEGKIENFDIATTFKHGKLKFSKGGVICEIPIGSLKKNAFYSNFGPVVPIRMTFLGNISSNIDTKITPYGFNSLVVEVYVHIEIEEYIIMPTSSKKSIIKIDAPLTLKIIQGIVPEYYYQEGIKKSSGQYSSKQ